MRCWCGSDAEHKPASRRHDARRETIGFEDGLELAGEEVVRLGRRAGGVAVPCVDVETVQCNARSGGAQLLEEGAKSGRRGWEAGAAVRAD